MNPKSLVTFITSIFFFQPNWEKWVLRFPPSNEDSDTHKSHTKVFYMSKWSIFYGRFDFTWKISNCVTGSLRKKAKRVKHWGCVCDALVLRGVREARRKKNFEAFFGEMNFINKSCRGRPCGHYGMIIMQLFGHFINEIIARNCT